MEEETHWLLVEVQKMRSEGLLVDVTLCAEGKEIPCHRLVLAANSEYFKVMFNGSHSESRKGKIEIGGVSAEALQLLVDYSYTGTFTVSTDNVHALFQAADMLLFPQVSKQCEEFLQEYVRETCLETWALADRLSRTCLAEKAKSWALKSLGVHNLYLTKEFLQLPFHLVKAYVSDEGLFAMEFQVLHAILLWVKYDLKEREEHLKELLKCVCFSSIGQDHLKNLLKEEKELAGVRGIRHMMRSQTVDVVPRQILQKNMLVIGGVRKTMTSLNDLVYRLNLDSECADVNPLPKQFQGSRGMAVCTFDNDVIVTGGDKSMSQAWRYKPHQNLWVKLANLRTRRYDHRMAGLGEELYVVGGAKNRRIREWTDGPEKYMIPDVEVYDKKSNRWKLTKQLRVAVSNFAIAACRGKLYVFGGETDEDFATLAVQWFDPKNEKWSLDPWLLPEEESGLSACTVGSKIYLVGGVLEGVWCFHPEEERFEALADKLVPWDCCSATVCGGEIYITGGLAHDEFRNLDGTWGNPETLPYVQCYNVNSDTMVLCENLPEPLYGHCTVTIDK
ncbi:PREDICTED: kelch-like protein 24 [Branchiostoma belcheri]|uniref:Kelch-like protein 24 n=1 Tax=Branchiostoma belcheri TaxID=7741 RepID=A0A6P4Z243_BRABE|nr:PREDICTED: kelch-like protein 24 [Branchiostoma belcheri]